MCPGHFPKVSAVPAGVVDEPGGHEDLSSLLVTNVFIVQKCGTGDCVTVLTRQSIEARQQFHTFRREKWSADPEVHVTRSGLCVPS